MTVRLFFVGIVWSLGGDVSPTALEPVAPAVHLQDVGVVCEPIQQNTCEAFRVEQLGPLTERQVSDRHDGTPLAEPPECIEEQFGPGLEQGDESQFIYARQIQPGNLRLRVEQTETYPAVMGTS